MTREEIKQAYSMKDILVKCGLPEPNRAGFIKCPFHKGDHEASMKVYDKDFHCFGCGANGDIFTFTEKFYGISFKDHFLFCIPVNSLLFRSRKRVQNYTVYAN